MCQKWADGQTAGCPTAPQVFLPVPENTRQVLTPPHPPAPLRCAYIAPEESRTSYDHEGSLLYALSDSSPKELPRDAVPYELPS